VPAIRPGRGGSGSWQAGLDITRWSTVTLTYGNCFTSVRLAGWGGTGPDMDLTFYHNSLSTVSGLSIPPASGINLGNGWTHAYGGQIWALNSTRMRVLEDDGTIKDFNWDSVTQTWRPPLGFYERLEASPPGAWTLTYRDRSARVFDAETGRLQKVADASGNAVQVIYVDGRVSEVRDAAGRRAVFGYTDQRLTSLTVPWLLGGWTRTFTFEYADGRLDTIHDPMGFTTRFVYDSAGRIRRVIDANGNSSLITYINGAVGQIEDPAPFDSQIRTIEYDYDSPILATSFVRTYRDRRGQPWVFEIGNLATRNLLRFTDPLNHTRRWSYDTHHSPLKYTDPLGQQWTYTYDANGNRLSATDPLGHRWTATYDLATNNVLTVTPPADAQGNPDLDKQVSMQYLDPANPTRLTHLTQPAPAPGENPVVTVLSYYGPNDHPEWTGQLARVTDPNGVLSTFEYDTYGQPARYVEGLRGNDPESQTITGVVETNQTQPGGGAGGGSGGGGGGTIHLDPNNRPTSGTCVMFHPIDPPTSLTVDLHLPPRCTIASKMMQAGCPSWDYDNAGRVLRASVCVSNPLTETSDTVDHLSVYDELDRVRSATRKTHEPFGPASPVSRTFNLDPHWTIGVFLRTGPDGDLTRLETDDAGRPALLERADTIVTYTFDAANRLAEMRHFGNQTKTLLAYDDAGRLVSIKHRHADDTPILDLVYQRSADGLITRIDETAPDGGSAVVQYVYDRLNRLTRETRTGFTPFDIEYTYDVGGNRRTKTDHLAGKRTSYFYDIDDPTFHGTYHNRIVRYEVRSTVTNELLETVWYGYVRTLQGSTRRETGWVEQVIRKLESDPRYYRTFFMYDTAGRPWIVIRDRWEVVGGQAVNCLRTFAREFRYDTGRARYLMRDLDLATLLPSASYAGLWTDYAQDTAYGDYTLSLGAGGPTATTAARYQPGAWERAGDALRVHHGDQIGTSRFMTNASAQTLRRAVYTAFGELVLADDGHGQPLAASRYGYAGAWGYETGLDDAGEPDLPPLPFIHVGERWYDPSSGRFLQRDPIGIRGGLNVYEYVNADPVVGVDPVGLDRWIQQDLLHSSITYGNSDIGYWKIEFGLKTVPHQGGLHTIKDAFENVLRIGMAITCGAPGVVTKTPVPRPNSPPTIATAKEEDLVLHKKFKDGDELYYNLWVRNCNHWAASNQGVGTGH